VLPPIAPSASFLRTSAATGAASGRPATASGAGTTLPNCLGRIVWHRWLQWRYSEFVELRGPVQKFEAIEGLRGWMAAWVVLGHAVELTGTAPFLPALAAKLLQSSYMAVQVFMIVSGFVIAHVLLTKREPYPVYLAHRWFRLMPLLLVVLAFAMATRQAYAMAWIDNPWAEGAARIARMRAEDAHWPVYLGLHLLLLHGAVPESLLPYAAVSFLAPAWSLSLEWQFYVLAPAIAGGLLSFRRCGVVALLLALSIPTLAGVFGTWQSSQPFLLQNLPFFFVGIASRHAIAGRIPPPMIAGCLAALAILVFMRGLGQVVALAPVVAIWALFLVFSAREARSRPEASSWLDRLAWVLGGNPALLALGRLSYALYLCHVPVLSVVVAAGMAATGRNDRLLIVALAIFGLAASLVVAWMLHVVVERTGIRLGRRLLSRESVVCVAPSR